MTLEEEKELARERERERERERCFQEVANRQGKGGTQGQVAEVN